MVFRFGTLKATNEKSKVTALDNLSATRACVSPGGYGFPNRAVRGLYVLYTFDMAEDPHRSEELSNNERLNRLRQAMYSRSISPNLRMRARHEIKPVDYGVKTDFETPEEPIASSMVAPQVVMWSQKLLWWVLIGTGLFFVASVGIFFYYFTIGSGGTVAAPGNIEISVRGPATVIGGEPSELQVVVTNHNQAVLELADLLVTYPSGTRSPTDFITDLPQQRISLGSIEPGGRRQGTVQAVLIGKEGARATSTMELEYRVKNSNAIFVAKTEYAFTFASAPISLALDANNEAISGQSMLLTMHITSGTDTVLKDVLFSMDYPFGFKVESRSPEPKYADVWELGDLRPGEEHVITIRGVLTGQEGDDRVFSARAGTRKDPNGKSISVELAETDHHVAVARPFIGLSLAVNKDAGTDAVSVDPGQTVSIVIPWVNNLSTSITNAVIVARLSGLPINQASVRTPDGFYRSSDNTVLWDKATSKGSLDVLEPGERGTVSFSFQMLAEEEIANAREASVDIAIHAAGKRISEASVPETLQASVTRSLKLASNAKLLARGFYYANPFGSVGPLPPKADQETTYGMVLTVKNTSNKLKDAKVIAQLPPYVRWIGVYSPAQERIKFNGLDGIIEWNIGDVGAGVGVNGAPPREVAFAIGLTPSASQIAQQPILLRSLVLSGTDTFTEKTVSVTTKDVNTNLIEDPGFSALEANVVQ